ncbi:sodium:solute symporter family protein [Ornithinicoccus halotolerans]|uniref:sodium:solute symporter family protein n=1 Tax=Ornithinicoccus halotolerans TaxID=1748220 RepID=UPI001296FD2F|nr:sodium:solute symporter family protein [Ornithinicoccus halotolerans]
MRITESVILLCYLALVTGIGVWFYRRARSSESDYFTAGNSIGTLVGAFAIFAAVASSSSLMGAVGSGATLGAPFFFAYAIGAVAILPFAIFLIAGQLRRAGVKTVPDFFGQRFGRGAQLLAAVAVVLAMTFYMVPQLTAAGLIGSYVLGVDYVTAVILLGLGFTLYAALGGMWAITYTDLIQGAIMLLGVLVTAAVVLGQHGGVAALVSDALAVDPAFGEVTQPWMSYFGLFIAFLWFGVVSPSVVMRNFASRDARTARRSSMWGTVFYLLLFLSGFVVMAAGVSLDVLESLEQPDLMFVSVVEHYLPTLLAGLMLAGLLAAIMSSADAMLLAISAGIAHDVYKAHLRPNASERQVTGLGLIVMVVASLIGILIAVDPPGLIAVMVGWVGGFLLSVFGFPIVLGLWWPRATSAGALAGMLGGFVTFGVLVAGQWLPTNAEPIVAAPVSLLLVVAGSLLTPAPPAHVQEMVHDYHRYREDAPVVG